MFRFFAVLFSLVLVWTPAQGAVFPGPPANRDIGHMMVIEDADGAVSRRNPFNLDNRTVAFLLSAPAAIRCRFQLAAPFLLHPWW